MMKKKGYKMGGRMKKGYKKGGKTSFPDLTGDGKVTQADILKGRGIGKKKGGSIKKFKKGKVVEDPTVVPPKGDRPPMTMEQVLQDEKDRLATEKQKKRDSKNNKRLLRPRKRPDNIAPKTRTGDGDIQDEIIGPRARNPPPTGPGGDKALPKSRPSSKPNRKEPGGTFIPPNIVGRSKKPEIGTIKMRGGGMAKKGYAAGGRTKGGAKGGKSKVRGAGIARKGVRPTKMR